MSTSTQVASTLSSEPTDDELSGPSAHPKNADFPEIVTVTHTVEKSEANEEHKLTYETGAPKGTTMVKKLSTITTTIRTTTPYTGTI